MDLVVCVYNKDSTEGWSSELTRLEGIFTVSFYVLSTRDCLVTRRYRQIVCFSPTSPDPLSRWWTGPNGSRFPILTLSGLVRILVRVETQNVLCCESTPRYSGVTCVRKI